jgi:hypothetical protein
MPLRAATTVIIETQPKELFTKQTRLYHKLYRVCEALINIQHIENRFRFLRGTTTEAQRNLLARQLDLQEELRRNEWAIKAAAAREVTHVANISTTSSITPPPYMGRRDSRPNTEPNTSMETNS